VRHLIELPRLATGKPDYAAITDSAVLRDLYAEILNRSDVTDDSTFVSLEGDSLSYVEMSIRIEQSLGHLPANWHTTPISALMPRVNRPRRAWRGWRQIETNVALRAAAIVLIVGSHSNVFMLMGGAHLLLGLAGFNFGRFHLTSADRRERQRHLRTSVSRVAVPSMCWIAGAAVLGGGYTVANVFLLNGVLGPDRWTEPQWHYWFIEVLVCTLVALAVVMSLPAVDRAERRWPFGFALGALALGLLTRFDIVVLGDNPDRIHTAHTVFWLFALGWATAMASSRWHRLLVSLVVLATVPGYFDDAQRDAVLVAGLLLLVWVGSVRVPGPVSRLAGVLASASLYIYLSHWQVYPHLENEYPLLGLLSSLVVGVIFWLVATRTADRVSAARVSLHDRRLRRRGPAGREHLGRHHDHAVPA
jgi:hypothetical protein